MIKAIVAGLYAAVFFMDFLPHRGESARGVQALYLVMLAVSFAVLMLDAWGVRVPSPAPPIQNAVRAIFGIS